MFHSPLYDEVGHESNLESASTQREKDSSKLIQIQRVYCRSKREKSYADDYQTTKFVDPNLFLRPLIWGGQIGYAKRRKKFALAQLLTNLTAWDSRNLGPQVCAQVCCLTPCMHVVDTEVSQDEDGLWVMRWVHLLSGSCASCYDMQEHNYIVVWSLYSTSPPGSGCLLSSTSHSALFR